MRENTSQVVKKQLIKLIETARGMDRLFKGSFERQILEDFKPEITRYLGGVLPK